MKTKNISIIAGLLFVAALIPAIIAVDDTNFGSSAHILEADVSQEEVLDMSTLIVKGKIVASHVEKVRGNGDGSPDTAYTVWKVKPDKTYKGADSAVVSFKTIGGKISQSLTTGSSVDFERGDQVIVMLVKDPGSVFGDDYHLVSIVQGAYTIENGAAKSASQAFDKTEIELENRINNHLN